MFWNPFTIAGVLDEILEWIAARVADVIDALWKLLSWAFLVVPDVTALPQVQAISTRALFIANTCYVVAIAACGVVVMGRDSVQARYGVAELAPRLLIGIIGANFALPMCRELIALGNALIQTLIGGPITTDGSLDQLRRTIVDALTNPANALLTLVIGVVIAVLAAMIMVGWVLRLGLLVILVGVSSAALACHGTPWTEPAAKLWWRAFLGVFATVGGQGIALHAGLTVFVSPTANLPALGLPNDPTGTLNLFIVCCLLLAVTRIPALVRRYVTGGQSRNVVGAFVRVAPAGRVAEDELAAMAGRAAGGAGQPGWRGSAQHPVRAHPHQNLNGQVGQQERQPGPIVAGVRDDPHVRITGLPLPGIDQSLHHVPQLAGGDRGSVVAGHQPPGVQRRGPRGAPGLHGGDERVRPARNPDVGVLAAPVGVAQHPLRAGMRLRPQPTRHIHRQNDPPVRGPRHRHRRHRRPQPLDVDPATVQRRIQRAVTPPMLTHQRQLHQGPHRRITTQQRVGQLEQRIPANGQTTVELTPKRGQPPYLVDRPAIVHTDHQTALDS